MSTTTSAVRVGVTLMALSLLVSWSTLVAQQAVTFDVQFALTTPDSKPIAGAPVRVVLGEQPGWQGASAGTRFTTDAQGQHQFSTTGTVTEMRRKLPTNFWTSLMSRAQATKHVSVATELPYVGKQWLYVAEVDRFKDGTSARLDAMRVYGVNPSGVYTLPVSFAGGEYSLPGIPGKLRVPGHEVSHFSAEPDAGGTRWKVSITVIRYPEPVRR